MVAEVESDEEWDLAVTSSDSAFYLSRNSGRGKRIVGLDRLQGKDLKSRLALISWTKSNVERARYLIMEFKSIHKCVDPEKVNLGSSLLILNLLAKYCKFGAVNALKNDRMGALIQGLRIVYEKHEHTTAWTVINGVEHMNRC